MRCAGVEDGAELCDVRCAGVEDGAELCDVLCGVQEFWTVQSPMQNTIILLVENIATALGTEFRMYLPHIVPMLLRVFMHDTSHERAITSKVGDR